MHHGEEKGQPMSYKITLSQLKDELGELSHLAQKAVAEMRAEGISDDEAAKFLGSLNERLSESADRLRDLAVSGLEEYNMIKFLNQLLKLEYNSIFDYQHYANSLASSALSEPLRSLGAMEIEHARMTINKIRRMGGKPKVNPKSLRRARKFSLGEMLKSHLKGEEETIELCEQGLGLFNDPEFQWLIGTIRLDEISHKKLLEDLLDRYGKAEALSEIQEKYIPPKELDFESDEPWVEG